MKTIRLKFVLLLFFIGVIGSNLQAQSHLEAMAKHLENRDDVKVTVVHRSKVDKVLEITFNNSSLQKEIQEAFSKDRDKAETVIEEKDKGKVSELFYTFQDEESTTNYIYNVSKSGKVSFTVIKKPRKN